MNTLKNNVQLIGRLGNDPELRTFDSGKKMSSFSMATNETYVNNEGEKIEDTQWHNVVAWGKKADLINDFLKKGSEIAIQGKLVNRNYEKDGTTKYITEISLNEVFMLDKKREE
ncbi:MAG: single-stranded DNA-binding protein [Reichenbachiella sp.]|uniref:single-stranded DNA-binding protein n=1 Tax=Reichenbachiella sp. TaxID=2184521 RepID=UPI00326605BC